MNTYVSGLLQQYRSAGVLLDTNILLLFFVGSLDPEQIPRCKRTKIFAVEDYDTLSGLLTSFEQVVTTPNILTEVSNLSGQFSGQLKDDYFALFAQGIMLLEEHYIRSADIAGTHQFWRLGITDAGIFHLVRGKYLTITDDFALSQYLRTQGADVLNFNEIRPLNWK
jgi:hypothetical protein